MNYPINIKYTKRKNSIAMKVVDGQIIILATTNSAYYLIERFLLQKKDWITAKINQNKIKLADNEFFLLGRKQNINYIQSDKNYFDLTSDNNLTLYYKQKLNQLEINFLFANWQQNFASQYILQRAKELVSFTSLKPNKILLKNTYSQWGSCSRNKNISLAINLIFTKKTVIDYVIIHELCHLEEMNHSKKFWQLVEKFCSNYRLECKWLKEHNFLIKHHKSINFVL